jgi:hypothetical protein
MKNKVIALCCTLLAFAAYQDLYAQTADEIIENYLEMIGGREKLAAVQAVKMTAKVKAQGMELPITMYQKAPGKQRMDLTFQGQKITQMCFDGETGWSTNFMTMEAEKWDAEQSMVMKSEMDFPNAFLNYKERGHVLTLEGEETIEGAECYKIKVVKKPLIIDGQEEENISFYFFDKEVFIPIMQREFAKTGQMKGQASETYFSDYQEVEGVYFPYTVSQKMGGQSVFAFSVDTLTVNEEIDDALFAFPGK